MENELTIVSGKIAKDHVHMFISYRPQQDISSIVQWLKVTSSRMLLQGSAFAKAVLGEVPLRMRVLVVSSGNITNAMISSYVDKQEGEPVHDDGQFLIDEASPKANLKSSRR